MTPEELAAKKVLLSDKRNELKTRQAGLGGFQKAVRDTLEFKASEAENLAIRELQAVIMALDKEIYG